MSRLMGMLRWGLWLILLALAWPAGGGLTLICGSSPQAPTLPCCEEAREGWEIPAGMLPDCCRVVPESRGPTGLAVAASLLQPDSWDRLSLAPALGVIASLGASLESASPPAGVPGSLPPPYAAPFFARTTVLRI